MIEHANTTQFTDPALRQAVEHALGGTIDETAIAAQIPTLEARGVRVTYTQNS